MHTDPMGGSTPVDDEPLAWPEDAVEVGRIVGAWGIRGGLRVRPYSAHPEALFSSRRWFLLAPEPHPAGPVPAAPVRWPLRLSVRDAREQGDDIVCTALEITGRTQAEGLKGARVHVRRHDFPTPAEGEYYWVDLIGLAVVNRAGEALGTVDDLLSNGPQSVLRVGYDVVDARGRPVRAERLIPFVDAYVDEVDLPGRIIRVDWGLDY